MSNPTVQPPSGVHHSNQGETVTPTNHIWRGPVFEHSTQWSATVNLGDRPHPSFHSLGYGASPHRAALLLSFIQGLHPSLIGILGLLHMVAHPCSARWIGVGQVCPLHNSNLDSCLSLPLRLLFANRRVINKVLELLDKRAHFDPYDESSTCNLPYGRRGLPKERFGALSAHHTMVKYGNYNGRIHGHRPH